jgi:AcrR family transcriptional regulator
MDPNRTSVNPKRPYDSVRRREQARQTRAAIIDVARRRLLNDGFAATTVAAIANEARVSVDTIYKAFGGKPGLVTAICQEALTGEGPVPAETRSDAMQATERAPREIIRGWGALTTEVAPRIAPILLLVRAAATAEPEMARLQSQLNAQRLERMTHNARSLANTGGLRAEIRGRARRRDPVHLQLPRALRAACPHTRMAARRLRQIHRGRNDRRG